MCVCIETQLCTMDVRIKGHESINFIYDKKMTNLLIHIILHTHTHTHVRAHRIANSISTK